MLSERISGAPYCRLMASDSGAYLPMLSVLAPILGANCSSGTAVLLRTIEWTLSSLQSSLTNRSIYKLIIKHVIIKPLNRFIPSRNATRHINEKLIVCGIEEQQSSAKSTEAKQCNANVLISSPACIE